KIAVAAAIIIAVLVTMNYLGSSTGGASIAWGDVVKNVEQAKTVTFRLRTSMAGMPDSEIMVYDSSEHGSRMDVYMNDKVTSRIYGPTDKNVTIVVNPESKSYSRTFFTEEQRQQMEKRQKDPREFVKLFLSVDHTKLGRKTIDGMKVEGLEVNSPKVGGGMFENAIGQLWVDVKTKLPVLMEIEGVSGGGKTQTKMAMDRFRWGEPLASTEFEPNIPADYTLMAETKMSNVNEDELIEGLRFFAELTGGRYPSSMASMTANHEMQEAWQRTHNRPATNEDLEKFHRLNAACQFYADLIQADRDVKYYGDKVTAGDTDAILMQWKLSDDEHRVIYGDLRVETIADSNKLLDVALKINGKKLSAEERNGAMRMLNLSEKDLIKGLGLWMELLDGRYPNSLDPKAAIKQADSLLAIKYGIGKQDNKEKKKVVEEKAYDIFFASAFYNKLVREKKDVAYYSDKITFENGGKVLMRWRISDNQYRVVFGNLTRKSVTAKEMSELEKLTSGE
ncbi:MAG: hypothetical protein NTX52_11085, partial [Planctomycetota bacterium]|nr:hypothetical protein [Planctomycetota bacterium]